MGTLDVESLCTSIALDETIVICINQLLENTGIFEGFTMSELKQLLCFGYKGVPFKIERFMLQAYWWCRNGITFWTFPC